jgi:hypothetical protein
MIIIPFTSESFDTATYLYQVKRLYDFDFISIDNWNKSYVLLYAYKIVYSGYISFLEFFKLTKDNLILFHVFFKLPLVISDLGIGLLIHKIANILKFNKSQKKLAVIAWIINPFVWYSAYMKGQYELIVAFVFLISIYFLISRKYAYSILTLATAFAFKYVFIILLPFYLLTIIGSKLNSNKFTHFFSVCFNSIIVYGGIFIFSYVANIFPFIDLTSFTKTSIMLGMHYGSVLNFVGSSNALINIGTPTVDGPIYKILYYFLYGLSPKMDDPIYALWQNVFSIYIFGTAILIMYGWHMYSILKKKKKPSDNRILYSLLTFLAVFYLTQSRIEAHWYTWSFPILILLVIFYKKSLISFNLSLLFLVTIAIFGSGPQKYHFANLNTQFEKYLPKWTLVNFSETASIILFSSYLLYLIYFLFTIKRISKFHSKYFNNSNFLSLSINSLILFLLVIFYFHASYKLIYVRNIHTTPINSISAARTWYYSTAIDPTTNKPFFPSIASKYIQHIFTEFPKVFNENFLLVLDKNTYQKNLSNLPKAIHSDNEEFYYFEFQHIRTLFEMHEGLIYINLNDATRATLMHSFDKGYAESYYFIKQKLNNHYFKKPYYLNKYKNQIFINSILLYVGFSVIMTYFTYNYYQLFKE